MPEDSGEAPHVELIRSFANTLDVEDATDAIATRRELTRWLHEHELLARRTPSTDEDLDLARRLRTGLREAMAAHHDDRPVASSELDRAAAELALRLSWGAEGPRLEPVDPGVRGALARILVAVNQAVIDDDWERLKVCPDDTCQWAFYDATKNRSKSWCGTTCGNKAKTRSYRQRQRTG
ncbi:MAG TPA: CGNR zinc finger domain-containing protein [Nocardioidaceae bacterium]|nr:CGNR zinc finger domain-containing protein [Nocardioidaceae bacterium]